MSPIGVLALQGAFAAHAKALSALGHAVREVRGAGDLEGISGLVLPGGESTVQLELVRRFGMAGPLAAVVRAGIPVLATCAGLILVARQVTSPAQPSFGWLDVTVARNAYGRQLDSFEATSDDERYPLLFIRAPRIVEVSGRVEVLATHKGEPVLVRERNVTACAFHPELTGDFSLHREVFGGAASARAA